MAAHGFDLRAKKRVRVVLLPQVSMWALVCATVVYAAELDGPVDTDPYTDCRNHENSAKQRPSTKPKNKKGSLGPCHFCLAYPLLFNKWA